MARGGGTRGGRGGGSSIPFDIDPELAEAVDRAEENGSGDDSTQELFPALPTYMVAFPRTGERRGGKNSILASPVTDKERRGVQRERETQAGRRAGPFWTGTQDEWREVDVRSGGKFDPFEGIATYGKKRTKKPFQLANLKKVKVCYPQFVPKELKHVVEESTNGTASADPRKKKLGLAKKSAVDKLAKLDGDERTVDADDEAENDDDSDKEDGEDDFEREPKDDDFEEGEDEGDDDYNAEKYFDDGEDDFDDGAADDYGDDDY